MTRYNEAVQDDRPFLLRHWWSCAASGAGVAWLGVQLAREDLIGVVKVVFVALFALAAVMFFTMAWQLARPSRR